MFTKQQLKLMIEIQAEDDWHPSSFFHQVKEKNDHELTAFLFSLTRDEIRNLQLALDLLGSLPR